MVKEIHILWVFDQGCVNIKALVLQELYQNDLHNNHNDLPNFFKKISFFEQCFKDASMQN
jgi:hypothetical protein